MTARSRRSVRFAMRELEDAVVALHDAEEVAAGRRHLPDPSAESQLSARRATEHLGRAREALSGASLTADEHRRAEALLDTVGLLVALREAAGGASIAARFLS